MLWAQAMVEAYLRKETLVKVFVLKFLHAGTELLPNIGGNPCYFPGEIVMNSLKETPSRIYFLPSRGSIPCQSFNYMLYICEKEMGLLMLQRWCHY